MAQYKRSVMTNAGVLLARQAMDSEITLTFTKIETGDGTYSDSEDLKECIALKNTIQSFALASKTIEDEKTLHLKGIISNVNQDGSYLMTGYKIKEVGIFAKATGGNETLYAIAIAEEDHADFIPQYDTHQPATVTIDWYATVGNTANIQLTSLPSAYASAEDVIDLTNRMHDAEENIQNNQVQIESNKEEILKNKKNWRVNLPANGWSEAFPYTQTVSVPEMKEDYSPIWGLLDDKSNELDSKKIGKIQIKRVVTGDGNVKVEARKKPNTDCVLLGKG